MFKHCPSINHSALPKPLETLGSSSKIRGRCTNFKLLILLTSQSMERHGKTQRQEDGRWELQRLCEKEEV